MILETIRHLLYPAPEFVKKMGYLRESIAIESRYKRCAHHWMPHLNKCKSLVLNATSGLTKNANIMIVGSGSLLDVPICDFIQRNFKVDCVDIVQLPHIIKAYPAVQFIQKDITELAHRLYQTKNNATFSPDNYKPVWQPVRKPDLVISLNILSQLPMVLMNHAKKRTISLPKNFEFNIRKGHIDWLKNVGQKTLLITDIKRNYFHKSDLIQSDPALTYADNDLIGPPQEQWIWNIAPVGETQKDIGIEHLVGVWKL